MKARKWPYHPPRTHPHTLILYYREYKIKFILLIAVDQE